MQPKQTATYQLNIPENSTAISIIVTWHRRIDGRTAQSLLTGERGWLDTPRLANFDLRLDYTNADGKTGVIGRSASKIDNVEHIYIEAPPSGSYRLNVLRGDDGYNEAWTYAVAWRVEKATAQQAAR